MAQERPLDDLTAAEIRRVIPELMQDAAYERVESHTLLVVIAERLGSEYGYRAGSWTRDKYAAKVTRALNALAADGSLLKAGAGQLLPGALATVPARQAFWYTQAGWEAAARRAVDGQKAEQEEARRWERIGTRAGGFGVFMPDPRQPTAHALEQLLDLAEGTGSS